MAWSDDPFDPGADPYPLAPRSEAGPAPARGGCPACSRRHFTILLAVSAAGAVSGCAPLVVNDVRRIACEPIRQGAEGCRHRYCRYYGGRR